MHRPTTQFSVHALAMASFLFGLSVFAKVCLAAPRIGPGLTVRTAATLGNGGAYEIYSRRLTNGKRVSFIGARQQSKNGVIRSVTIQSRLGRSWSLTTLGDGDKTKIMKRPLSDAEGKSPASEADLKKIRTVTNGTSIKSTSSSRGITGRSDSDPWGVPLRLFYSTNFALGLEDDGITDYEAFWRAKLLEVESPFRLQINTHFIPSFVLLDNSNPTFASADIDTRIHALWENVTNVQPYRTEHPPEGIFGIVDLVELDQHWNSQPFLCVAGPSATEPNPLRRATTGTFALSDRHSRTVSIHALEQCLTGAMGPGPETSNYIMGSGAIHRFSDDTLRIFNNIIAFARCDNSNSYEDKVCCINKTSDVTPFPTATPTRTPVAGAFAQTSNVTLEIRSKRLLVVRIENIRKPLPRLKARVLTAGGKLIKEFRLSTQGSGSYRLSKNLARGSYYARVWDTKKVGKSSAKVIIS